VSVPLATPTSSHATTNLLPDESLLRSAVAQNLICPQYGLQQRAVPDEHGNGARS
jgi:hypothetical protein